MPVATTTKRAMLRRNWFINPGAEGSDVSQWLQYFSCPRAVTTEDKYSGTQSMKYSPNSNVNVQGPIMYITPAAADRPWSGAVMRCSFWAKGPAGWKVSISNRCASATRSWEGLNAVNHTMSGGWERFVITSTLPYETDGRSVQFNQFGIQMPTTSGTQATQSGIAFYIDNVCIELHPDGQAIDYPDDYFDGSMTGCRWWGTANASSSEKITPVLIPVGSARIYRTDATRNMVRNGFGELGNNTNFPSQLFDATDRPSQDGTIAGSFYSWTNAGTHVTADAYLVDVTKTYEFSFWARQRTAGDTATAFSGLAPYDRAHNIISPSQYMYQANTTTTLAQDLVNGATKVYLTSAANWHNSAGTSVHLRSLIFWNWTDTFGTLWPQHTYSRQSYTNVYDDGAVNLTDNSITLRVPWASGTFLAGRPVSNGSSGGSYLYAGMPNNVVLSSTWTQYSATFTGQHTAGTEAGPSRTFPYGTHWIRPVFLLNRSNSTSRHAIAGLKLTSTGPWLMPVTLRRGADVAAAAQLLGWDFTGPGVSAQDTTGNNRTGVASDPAMRVSNALTISTSSHRQIFASDAATRPALASISCWINVATAGSNGDGFPMHHARAWDSTSIGFWMHRSGAEVEVQAVVRTANNVLVFTASTAGVTQNAWHHLALTYDGANAYLYINGTMKSSGAATGDLVWTTDTAYHSWQIGNHQHMPSGMTGYQVDDVRLYNRGLTAAEVSALAATRA